MTWRRTLDNLAQSYPAKRCVHRVQDYVRIYVIVFAFQVALNHYLILGEAQPV